MLDPQQQDSMIKKWPPSEVLAIDTYHCPFFSAPEQLFNLIANLYDANIQNYIVS
jgi:hypothetical protein